MLALSEQIIVNGLLSGIVYVLMAMGFTLVFGILRIVNFAHGEFYMVGAFGVFVINGLLGYDYTLSVIASMFLTIMLAAVIERLLYSPFVGDEFGSMIMSLAVSITLQSMALIWFGPNEVTVDRPISGVVHFQSAIIALDRALVAVCALGILLTLYLFLKLTKIGLAMRAIAQDAEVSSLMGVRSERIRTVGFMVAAALAALAGGLMAPIYTVGPYMGEIPMLKAFVIVILGGLGSIPGAALGGLLLGLIESLFATFFDSTVALIGSFLVVIVVILFKPEGLMGKITR